MELYNKTVCAVKMRVTTTDGNIKTRRDKTFFFLSIFTALHIFFRAYKDEEQQYVKRAVSVTFS